jgi:hypothetical protein
MLPAYGIWWLSRGRCLLMSHERSALVVIACGLLQSTVDDTAFGTYPRIFAAIGISTVGHPPFGKLTLADRG